MFKALLKHFLQRTFSLAGVFLLFVLVYGAIELPLLLREFVRGCGGLIGASKNPNIFGLVAGIAAEALLLAFLTMFVVATLKSLRPYWFRWKLYWSIHLVPDLKAIAQRLSWPAKKALDVLVLLVILAAFLWPIWLVLLDWHGSTMALAPFLAAMGWGPLVTIGLVQTVYLCGYAVIVLDYFD